jgi:hypothetical protein
MSELGGSLYLFYVILKLLSKKRYKLKVDCVGEKTNGEEQMVERTNGKEQMVEKTNGKEQMG